VCGGAAEIGGDDDGRMPSSIGTTAPEGRSRSQCFLRKTLLGGGNRSCALNPESKCVTMRCCGSPQRVCSSR
jgi:hypothetical protein